MKPENPSWGRAKTLMIAIPVILILLPIGYSAAAALIRPDAGQARPLLVYPEGEDECVREIEYMRYHHWDLLKEIRDRVQREGDREGLAFEDCMRCHDKPETFCNRCHEHVNLTPDCIGCHDYP
jgi:hypothetical protein